MPVARRLFFYGTLCHLPLLEAVLGQGVPVEAADLPDHAAHWVKDQPFPMISEAAGETADGVVVTVTDDQVARLDYYEGSFHYDLRAVEVIQNGQTRQAEVYFPDATVGPKGKPWSLTDWAEAYGALTVEAALEEMSYFGTAHADRLKDMQPMIRTRAQSRLNAQEGRKGIAKDAMSAAQNVRIAERRRPYVNFFALDEFDVSFDNFDGTPSPTVERAVFIGADAVCVLPYDPVRDRVLLVEQMRMGPLARSDPNPWMLEPIAGRIDAGETPEQAGHREAAEEAGLTLARLEPMGDAYPSPGGSTDYFYMYCAICDLPDSIAGLGGLDSEVEDIRTLLVSFDQLMEMSDQGHLPNAVLAHNALWLARHRDRLRNDA